MRKILVVSLAVLFSVLCPVAVAVEASALDTLKTDNRFKTFAEALEKAGLAEDLKHKTALTIFAPTEDAFTKLSDREKLFADNSRLAEFVKGHVVADQKISFAELKEEKSYSAMSGTALKLDPAKKVNGVAISGEPVNAANATIYAIEEALQPKKDQASAAPCGTDWFGGWYGSLFNDTWKHWMKYQEPLAKRFDTATESAEKPVDTSAVESSPAAN
ncbi:MAG TPA: fasciclin domain-containing protein [Planctomycetota bacterium]|nr:fasciclin domain-containing protein [Planctomycetota bacterium]